MANRKGQGRRADPTALKILKGTNEAHPERMNDNEPEYEGLGVEAPEWLDAEAKREWDRLAPSLEATGLLTVADKMAFEAYCWSYAVFKYSSQVVQLFRIMSLFSHNMLLIDCLENGIPTLQMLGKHSLPYLVKLLFVE